ncbi:MAG: TonB-dependent receptor [Pseudomonadota bacterium]|nr:TonB-dependent receptor [Pseudomonadota bacterium]
MKQSKTAFAISVALGASLYSNFVMSDDSVPQNVENIVVYGQKIERSVQETKESVSVITLEEIERMPIADINNVFDITPNAYDLGFGETFGLRGVSQNSLSTGGGDGALATLYIDNVAYTGFSTRFNSKDLWDIAQVEILRGPQSTNVGRNALIGAVVVQTKRPELGETSGKLKLEAGNYGQMAVSGMFNTAVTESSAFRISGQYNEKEGHIKNATLNTDDFDARDNTNVRAQYYVELTNDLTANLMLGYVDTHRGQDIYRADLQPEDSFTASDNLVGFEDYEGMNAALTIDYAISEQLDFTAITSYFDGEYQRFDDDGGAPTGGNAYRGRDGEDTNWAQELRLTYQSDVLRGVAGVYYTEVEVVNNTKGYVGIFPADVGVPEALLPFYPAQLEIDVLFPFDQKTTNYAFYTEWDYRATDKLTLSAGFRYDNEEQTSDSATFNSLAAGTELPDPIAAGQTAEQMMPGLGAIVEGGVTRVNAALNRLLTPRVSPTTEVDYNAFLPQVGVTYDVNEDLLVSAFYKEGYRAGGAELSLGGRQNDYDPEYLSNYELALRSMLLDGDLILNANAYYGDWTEQQVTICDENNSLDCITENAGASEIYGVELSSQYTITQDANMFASVGYAHTEFTDFNSGTLGDLTGNEFAYSPNLTAAIGSTVYLTDEMYVSGNINYQDDVYSNVQNEGNKLEGRTLVNIKAGYLAENYSIEAYVNNLTDEFYLTSDFMAADGSRTVRGGLPRMYGISFTYSFN